mgnify:CR=1 FL=1
MLTAILQKARILTGRQLSLEAMDEVRQAQECRSRYNRYLASNWPPSERPMPEEITQTPEGVQCVVRGNYRKTTILRKNDTFTVEETHDEGHTVRTVFRTYNSQGRLTQEIKSSHRYH